MAAADAARHTSTCMPQRAEQVRQILSSATLNTTCPTTNKRPVSHIPGRDKFPPTGGQ